MAVWFHNSLRRWSMPPRTIQRLTQSILAQVNRSTAHISVSVIGTDKMRRLNRTYRHRDYATDVLAFPADPLACGNARFLGDVAICLPTARAQAERFCHTPDQEFLRLLIHGTLHLVGYDHERSEKEALRMQRKERAIFNQLSPTSKIIRRLC